MTAKEYKAILARIVYNLGRKRFPGVQKIALNELSVEVARNIHARMYGANIDGVDSPIWTNTIRNKPNVEAKELLNENE